MRATRSRQSLLRTVCFIHLCSQDNRGLPRSSNLVSRSSQRWVDEWNTATVTVNARHDLKIVRSSTVWRCHRFASVLVVLPQDDAWLAIRWRPCCTLAAAFNAIRSSRSSRHSHQDLPKRTFQTNLWRKSNKEQRCDPDKFAMEPHSFVIEFSLRITRNSCESSSGLRP